MEFTHKPSLHDRLFDMSLAAEALHARVLVLTIAKERMPEYPAGGTIDEMLEVEQNAFNRLMEEIRQLKEVD